MAKVTQPLGSVEARGAIGGYVYQPWRGIQTVRSRATPADVPGSAREGIKTLMASVSAAWRNLTDAQRSAWAEYARLHLDPYWTGEDLRLPAFQRFCKMRFLQEWAGYSGTDDPPSLLMLHELSTLNLVDFGGQLTWTWAYSQMPGEPSCYLDAWAIGPHSAGRNMTIHDCRHMFFEVAADLSHTTLLAPSGTWTSFARLISPYGQDTPWIKCRVTF
jgi:hypothetical protein